MNKFTITLLLAFISLISYAQNNALSFDGTDDHVELGQNFDFTVTDSFTVEAWVKIAVQQQQQIISKIGDETGNIRGWGFQITPDGLLSAYVATSWSSDMEYVAGVTSIADNEWHHVAMTYNGSNTLSLFIDGTPEPLGNIFSSGSLTTIETTAATNIGSADYNGNRTSFFNGNIDEFRIWDDRRTQSEIQSNFQSEMTGFEENLVGYYKFDDPSSSCDIQDCSPSLAHGTRSGAAGTNNLPQFSSEIPVISDVACGAVIACELSSEDFSLEREVSLTPNPTYGILSLIGPSINTAEVNMYNATGALVRAKTILNNSLDISDLTAGIYFIEFKIDQKRIVKKVIKL